MLPMENEQGPRNHHVLILFRLRRRIPWIRVRYLELSGLGPSANELLMKNGF